LLSTLSPGAPRDAQVTHTHLTCIFFALRSPYAPWQDEELNALRRQYDDHQSRIRAGDLGRVVADLAEAAKGAAVSNALDEAQRFLRRHAEEGVIAGALKRAETEISAFVDEAARQQMTVESAHRQRSEAQKAAADTTYQLKELEAAVKRGSALEANTEVQTALRIAGSALRYTTTRLSTGITAAWASSNEVESEKAAVAEAQARVDELDALVAREQQRTADKTRDRKIAQSTLELALSKLEGLARTVSDSGVNKEAEVQRAIEDSEDAYLTAKKRFGYDEVLDPAAADELVKMINDAELVAKRVSAEHQQRARDKESVHERVSKLVARLAAVGGLCDASGPLVGERLHELLQGARVSVNAAVRLSRREVPGAQLDSALEAAGTDLSQLEKTAGAAKDEVASAEAEYTAARERVDRLIETIRAARGKADAHGAESLRGIGAILGEAETAIKLCRMHMLGVQSWLNDPATAKRLLEDAVSKVEMAEEEVDRDVAQLQAVKQEQDAASAKQGQLRARHEKVCRSIQQLKTSPPPRLIQAISATDKAMSDALLSKSSASNLAHMENLVKEEEDMLLVDVHASEKRLLDLEKAAVQVPVFLQKLASLDAQIEAAGVHVAALVEADLGEAHRAVRSLEHALDAESASPSPTSLREVDDKVKVAESAVATQVRRVTNAMMAHQEAKAQLTDITMTHDELNESAVAFSAQWDQLHFQIASDWSEAAGSFSWNLNASPSALSSRLITQAIKRSEQLVAHARRRIEVPITVWMEFGPAVAQNALDNAREGVRAAKTVVDSEQAKLDSNDMERKSARAKLEECAQSAVSSRALVEGISDSTDVSAAQDAIDGAERAVDVALRVLAHGTVASSASAMEVAVRKTAGAEALCRASASREERVERVRKHVREHHKKTRAKLEAAKEAASFLEISNAPAVGDALSAAERALIGVDLVLKCEFGLPMLRKEMQAAASAVDDFIGVVDREKARVEVDQRLTIRKKYEERQRHQKAIEAERSRAMEETLERRSMQDKLEAAIHRLQMHWPAVVDVQNSMTAAESSVEAARAKLASGGLAAASAAVSSALAKVQSLEATAKSIENSFRSPAQVPTCASLAAWADWLASTLCNLPRQLFALRQLGSSPWVSPKPTRAAGPETKRRPIATSRLTWVFFRRISRR